MDLAKPYRSFTVIGLVSNRGMDMELFWIVFIFAMSCGMAGFVAFIWECVKCVKEEMKNG